MAASAIHLGEELLSLGDVEGVLFIGCGLGIDADNSLAWAARIDGVLGRASPDGLRERLAPCITLLPIASAQKKRQRESCGELSGGE
jgi:hypothetical protein